MNGDRGIRDRPVRATFREFVLPAGFESAANSSAVVIPTIKIGRFFKHGKHVYYFINFKAQKVIEVSIKHCHIILPGLARFRAAKHPKKSIISSLFDKFHYGFNFMEQIFFMTIPHCITDLGEGRFRVNLWSYVGCLDVDCRSKTITYRMLDEEGAVLGSAQHFDSDAGESIYISYSLNDSFARIENPEAAVACALTARHEITGEKRELWRGSVADYLHDIVVSRSKRYVVVSELGMYCNSVNDLLPSKVLVYDRQTSNSWVIDRFAVAAHALFDVDDESIVYFSSHNFNFTHTKTARLFRNSSYDITYRGPASIYKYRLTEDGPQELAVFSDPDFFRLTNFHTFKHRGRTIIAAIGAPNRIYLVDPDTMSLIRFFEIKHPESIKAVPSLVGTFSPSCDGEDIFVHTNRSLQMVNIASGMVRAIWVHSDTHMCANHMITTANSAW